MTEPARKLLGDTLRWALEATMNPAAAAADWIASDIDPERQTIVDLLSDADVTIDQLTEAKDAFKTMRVVGEMPADRRLAARLYAAAIAAALVHRNKRISRQSDAALGRAFRSLLDDRTMHQSLRTIAGLALCILGENANGLSGVDSGAGA